MHCRLLKQDLPALDRAPFRNELGQKILAEVSSDGWKKWLTDSVKLINTYRVDLGFAGRPEVHAAPVCGVLRIRGGRGRPDSLDSTG